MNQKLAKLPKLLKLAHLEQLDQHFLDMGIIPGTELTLEKFAPMGDPMELRIHGYELTLRVAEQVKLNFYAL